MKKRYLVTFVMLFCLITGCSRSENNRAETATTDKHVTDPVRAAENLSGSPAGNYYLSPDLIKDLV